MCPYCLNIQVPDDDVGVPQLVDICLDVQREPVDRLGCFVALLRRIGLSGQAIHIAAEFLSTRSSKEMRGTTYYTIAGGLMMGLLHRENPDETADLLQCAREEPLPVLFPIATALRFLLGDSNVLDDQERLADGIRNVYDGARQRRLLNVLRKFADMIREGKVTSLPLY